MTEGGMPSSEALGGIISTLMSNPALLQNIKNVIGDISFSDNKKDTNEDNDEAKKLRTENSIPADIIDKLPQLMKAFSGKGENQKVREREALLCALKPFLSSERAEKIDKLINIIRIGDVLSGYRGENVQQKQ